jgi:D-sedoheptulose 7-phosphate isomerase
MASSSTTTTADGAGTQAALARQLLLARNAASAALFPAQSARLALACQEMAERFLRGGRLLAFGQDQHATDAEHVSVEFVHPVIVGKRALPALDLSRSFRRRLEVILRPADMVMGFGPPGGDPAVTAALDWARSRGAQVFAFGAAVSETAPLDAALSGTAPLSAALSETAPLSAALLGNAPLGAVLENAPLDAALRSSVSRGAASPDGAPGQAADAASTPAAAGTVYSLPAADADPYIHQELVELLYHTLWETVHVFFEHRERGHEVGAAGFLYPFLERQKQDTGEVIGEVAASIRAKAAEVERLRAEVAGAQAEAIATVAAAMRGRLRRGGQLILFGNGGSATDANDWALDCAVPLKGFAPIPALSLAMEPANITAVANDIGTEAVFLRQLIAQAGAADVAVALSTSGGSANIIAALGEARKRGLLTVALLGYGGGEIVRRGLADLALVVPCDYIPRIQEVQASIYHVLLELIAAPSCPAIGGAPEEPEER